MRHIICDVLRIINEFAQCTCTQEAFRPLARPNGDNTFPDRGVLRYSGLTDSYTIHLTYRLSNNKTICTLSIHAGLTQRSVNKSKKSDAYV